MTSPTATDNVTATIEVNGRLITRFSPGVKLACHGLYHDALLVVPSALFVLYLGYHSKRNLKRLRGGTGNRAYVMITYYAFLWVATLLNLAWSFLQAWQCTPGKQVSWSILSVFTTSAMLCLEISLMAFLLQETYASGLETLAHTFSVSGIFVGVDMLLKAILIFGFGMPLFMDVEITDQGTWGVWFIHKLLLTAAYGYILFVHYSKWKDKLPPRPAFYNYVMIMFATNVVALTATALTLTGLAFGLWMYNFTLICYHALYLPLIYITFLADFFQEQDFLLETAYYSEMRDAGFFDEDWD
ncbi:hypothetical protein Leryth_021242 [Lithospermum erythrorhizon]|nr:hypothetical protein Leryth_021242 [Lithospermum erythrorhizon]